MKGRTEAIERARATLAELQPKYGLRLRGPNGESLYDAAVNLKLTRKIFAPAKTVIPCAASLADAGKAEPCLIIPATLPIELWPPHAKLAVGGQVISLGSSRFTLPPYVMDASFRSSGYWKGELMPILVSIRGEYRFLVRANSYFYRYQNFTGADIDHSSPIEPVETDLKAGRYYWGNDLSDELTVVVAEM